MENFDNFGNFDVNTFDFGNMTQDKDPFAAANKSYVDERFYVLPKKSDGTGHAIVALMPDKHKHTIIRMFKINTTITRNGRKRFINTWSPKTIDLPCPFNETYLNHWDEDHDLAKQFKPAEKWVCNIKVIKDPENPDNEGKIFLYEMSKTMAKKIQETLTVTQADLEMGVERKEVFNPFKGWLFNLKCYKKESGMTSYDNSDFTRLPDGRSIYNMKGPLTDEDKKRAIDDILNNTYDLSELHNPENFKSYEELTEDLKALCRGTFGIGVDPKGKSDASDSSDSSNETEHDEVNINEPNNNINAEVNSSNAVKETEISIETQSQSTQEPASKPVSKQVPKSDDLEAYLNGLV